VRVFTGTGEEHCGRTLALGKNTGEETGGEEGMREIKKHRYGGLLWTSDAWNGEGEGQGEGEGRGRGRGRGGGRGSDCSTVQYYAPTKPDWCAYAVGQQSTRSLLYMGLKQRG
jgi:hypothetical protein